MEIVKVVVFLAGLWTTSEAIRCFHCMGIDDISKCGNIVDCPAHSPGQDDLKCWAKGYYDDTTFKYDLDCADVQLCASLEPNDDQNDQNDPIDIWSSCCDGELCNKHFDQTGNEIPPEQRHMECHLCKGIADPVDCRQSTTCDAGEVCFTTERVDNAGGEIFDLGCLSRQTCELFGHHLPIGKRRTMCRACCDSRDYCNNQFCSRKLGITGEEVIGSSVQPITTGATPTTTDSYDRYSIEVTPHERFENVLNTANFTCKLTPDLSEMVNMSWYFRNVTEFEHLIYSENVDVPELTLYIHNLDTSDDGAYICRIFHPSKTWIASGHLHVNHGAPRITRPPLSQAVALGGSVKLECVVAGDPVPTVQWSFRSNLGSTLIPSGTVINVDDSVDIQSMTTDHVGTWTCFAVNSYGNDQAAAYLSLQT